MTKRSAPDSTLDDGTSTTFKRSRISVVDLLDDEELGGTSTAQERAKLTLQAAPGKRSLGMALVPHGQPDRDQTHLQRKLNEICDDTMRKSEQILAELLKSTQSHHLRNPITYVAFQKCGHGFAADIQVLGVFTYVNSANEAVKDAFCRLRRLCNNNIRNRRRSYGEDGCLSCSFALSGGYGQEIKFRVERHIIDEKGLRPRQGVQAFGPDVTDETFEAAFEVDSDDEASHQGSGQKLPWQPTTTHTGPFTVRDLDTAVAAELSKMTDMVEANEKLLLDLFSQIRAARRV